MKLQHLLTIRERLERYQAALHAIHGAILLARSIEDALVVEIVLHEIEAIVAEALGQPHRVAANDWEG